MKELVQITRYSRSEYRDLAVKMARDNMGRLLGPQFPLVGSSTYRSTSVTAKSRQKPPDCADCGACCTFPLVVSVARGNEERLKEYWEITSGGVVVERVLGRDIENGHCVHFEGVLGETSSCGIYENRPDACRMFEAGSDRCLEYRRRYGIDPRLTDDELKSDLAAIKKDRVSVITESSIDVSWVNTTTSISDAGEMTNEMSSSMSVSVRCGGGESPWIKLFEYDASEEQWYESEFLGLTLDEAHQKIATRLQKS